MRREAKTQKEDATVEMKILHEFPAADKAAVKVRRATVTGAKLRRHNGGDSDDDDHEDRDKVGEEFDL